MVKSTLLLPIPICRDYNTPVGCTSGEKCNRLHICKYYVFGTCRKGDSCSRYHGIPDCVKEKQNNNVEGLQKALVKIKEYFYSSRFDFFFFQVCNISQDMIVGCTICSCFNFAYFDSQEMAKVPEGIPTPRSNIVPRPLKWLGRTFVFFDLQTTGLGLL